VEPSAGSASGQAPGGRPLPEARGSGEAPSCAVEWTVNPWRENRAAAAGAALVVLGLWLLVLRLLPGERTAATLLGLLLLASLSPGMAPTRCRVDEDGAARQVLFTWERRRWADIRRARLAARGLFVSPLARPGRLDRFRGLFLPLPSRPGEGAELREALRRKLEQHGL
jgi:hypothetical protein